MLPAVNPHILKAEKLHYILKSGKFGGIEKSESAGIALERAKSLFIELAEEHEDILNKLLPGEIRKYVQYYSLSDQYEIYKRIAEMDARLGHNEQAAGHWEIALQLSQQLDRPDWQVEALLGLHNVTWRRDVEKTLADYLPKAKALCDARLPQRLPDVLYEFGFAYRQKQELSHAIEWYNQAEQEWKRQPKENANQNRLATILNDRGYVWGQRGNKHFASRDVREARRLRQQIYIALAQELDAANQALANAVDPAERNQWQQQVKILKRDTRDAHLRVGYSYNTLGEISRFDNDPGRAIDNYDRALEIFEAEKGFFWQVKAYHGRAEAYRRSAHEKGEEEDELGWQADMAQALSDSEQSVLLCEQHQVDEERATAHRRLGRVLHDLALRELGQHNNPLAQRYLDQSVEHFRRGLKFARATRGEFELLHNLTELAFIADDLHDLDPTKATLLHTETIAEWEAAIQAERDSANPLYQLPVFEHQLKLEKAAFAYRQEKYSESLEGYVKGYIGLASDPGYGSAKYQDLERHLKRQITGLPDSQAVIWCAKFIEAWEQAPVIDSIPSKTLAQEYPNIIAWWREHKASRLG